MSLGIHILPIITSQSAPRDNRNGVTYRPRPEDDVESNLLGQREQSLDIVCASFEVGGIARRRVVAPVAVKAEGEY